jgi:FlaA1/EpsC-like NDP-sugar epimerase
LRPGEKLYEELLADGDRTVPTAFARLRIAQLGEGEPAASLVLEKLPSLDANATDTEARQWLRQVVLEWVPAAAAP